MAKKGKGSKKKQSKEDKKDSLPEVDKEYYEIQIADLNKKLNRNNSTKMASKKVLHTEREFYELEINTLNERVNRLKQRCSELEKENLQVQKNYKTLDEDRAAALAYLKHKMEQKNLELQDVTQRLQALQSAKDAEKGKYEEQILTMEKDYKVMQDQYFSEVKLLNGQLASLESFKMNRENMIKRLAQLEDDLKKKDEYHSQALRYNENKYILMKEKLSATVEEKLLQLSLDLQKLTQSKMAESTHNVVKENIAINNELNLIIGSWQKMFDENEALKENIKGLKRELEITKDLKVEALEKNKVLNQTMDRLLYDHEKMQEQFSAVYFHEQNNKKLANEVAENEKKVRKSEEKAQQLKVALHATSTELEELKLNFKKLTIHNCKLEEKIKDAVMIIKDVIGLQERKTGEDEAAARKQLLYSLLELFDNSLFQTPAPLIIDRMGSQDSQLAEDWIKNSQVLKNCAGLKRTTRKRSKPR